MEIASKYDPSIVEEKWYQYWMNQNLFHSVPDEREPYTIVIPPPNVTGVLHMGHMLNNTIQDVLVRRARMQGKNACWVPGTDHASIATEAKVVNMLKERGIEKRDLSRDEFMKYAWEWKEKHGGIILKQLRKLGASCDWERTKFTMDPELSEAVTKIFVDLYHKGKIYRGVRMVNWDPKAMTAVSDEEVVYKELQSKLYYVRYQIEGEENEYITIATTRPEFLPACVGIFVNPEDERYKHLIGKNVILPIVNKLIPVISDIHADKDFVPKAILTISGDEEKKEVELTKPVSHAVIKVENVSMKFNIATSNTSCTNLYRRLSYIPSSQLQDWTLEGDAIIWQKSNPL